VEAVEFAAVSAEEDLLAAHRPEAVFCSDLAGWYLEGALVEVDTARCNYFAASAPAPFALAAGDVLEAQVVHFDLTAPEPARAHVALLAGAEVLWEREIVVPGAGDVLPVVVELSVPVAADTPVGWHLHNHGQNHWRLSGVEVRGR
jgi:hypothetical protein